MSHIKFVVESLFRIYNKKGELVDFKLNSIQQAIDQEIIEKDVKRATILKFRQGGCTSYIMAYFLVECMSKFCRAVMLAHDRTHTEKLLRRCQLFLQTLKGPKPIIQRMNANEIVFAKTGSSFHIGTAGNMQFGRSDTITHLHMSEFAFWPNPEVLLTGLLQAVPHETGIVVMETTGNGWGSYHQKLFYKSLAGETRYKALFFPWYMFDEYVSENPLSLEDLSPEEAELMHKYSLNLKQLRWRREKIDEFNGDITLFNQEYPSKIEDAFRLTGGSLFNPILGEKEWIQEGQHGYLAGHPIKDRPSYVFGADVAGGSGNDYSAIVGLDAETLEQVYQYRSNTIDPVKFAHVLASMGKRFNNALIVVEANQHGISTLSILKEIYPKTKIYSMPQTARTPSSLKQTIPALHYGWRTTITTKPYMVGVTVQFLLEGLLIYDRVLFDELRSFSETAEGRLEGLGDHDDTAIALMLACIGLLKYRRLNSFTLEEQRPMVVQKRNIEPTWRDEHGRLLIPFTPKHKLNGGLAWHAER